jgi:glycosyltransferase involved in cell wall biosynthesis
VGNVVAELQSGGLGSAVAAEAVGAGLPTLAEELSKAAPSEHAPASPLTVLVERRRDLEGVLEIVPQGSLVVDVSSDGPEPNVHPRGTQLAAHAESAGELLEIARSETGDVLLVSDGDLLTASALGELRSTFIDDSACATACVDDVSRVRVSGVPPPAVDRPRPGVVLLRRDHFLLALEEADLVGRDDIGLTRGRAAATGVVADVLTCVDRPGFVHRAIATEQREPTTAIRPPPRASKSRSARIVLDGRCLAEPFSGTQLQVLGLLGGLARAGADVALMQPGSLHPTIQVEVQRLRGAVPFVRRSQVGRPDVFHRPYQARSLHELADCLSIGERLVLTHQDMILDRTRSYANTDDSWRDYRRTTTAALSSADEVGFFSRHAALDAASDGALDLGRATVVTLGVDHLSAVSGEPVSHPLNGRPFLLVVGNSYWHKNRLFAVRLVQWLVESRGWDGGLVLAGGHPGRGSSRDAERALLAAAPALRPRVADLGHVSGVVQSALYRDAELVVFPSLYEGFGLIPFEAALAGTACVYNHRASMRELLPAIGALPSLDVDEAGEFVFSLLRDDTKRARVVTGITEAARTLTWDRTAAGYLEVYRRAIAREPRGVSRALVNLAPKASRVTPQESLVLDVYRRRRGFRLAVDGVIRAGTVGLRAARHLHRGEGPNE